MNSKEEQPTTDAILKGPWISYDIIILSITDVGMNRIVHDKDNTKRI